MEIVGYILLVTVTLLIIYLFIKSLIEKPDKPGFKVGGLLWGMIYYLVHGMWAKGLILIGIAFVISVVTMGYGAPVVALAFGIYCGVKAHDDWVKVHISEKEMQLREIEVDHKLREYQSQPQATVAPMVGGVPPGSSVMAKLEELKQLREKGYITAEEFEQKRKSIIDAYN
jgi:hypothetical protein